MELKKGSYIFKVNPAAKRKIAGKLRSKMAVILEKSDKEHEQAARDIMRLRLTY